MPETLTAPTHVEITRLAGHIGAEITGADTGARTVLGFTASASRDLIRLLQDYITRPEHTVRWHWREDDLAIWDNRATQHYAIADYGAAHRRGERVTVAGPVPLGVDGRPSVAVRGDASGYYAGGVDY